MDSQAEQPAGRQTGQISVVEPISSAAETVKRILFRPFNLGRWFTIGFCAWLVTLGEGSVPNFRGWGYENAGNNPGEFLRHNFNSLMLVLLPIIVFVGILVVVIAVLVLWLSSRGRFMLLYCVAQNKSEVVNPWKRYRTQGNSLFWFRLVTGIIGLIGCAPIAAGIAVPALMLSRHSIFGVWPVAVIVAAVILLLGWILLLVSVKVLTGNFVIPVMYLRGCRVMEGWRQFWGLLRENKARFLGYLLFKIVLHMGVATVIFILILVTCCCACCIMMIPYIGTVFLLPVIIFMQAYSLHYLAQYGREFDVFAPEGSGTAAGQPEQSGQPAGPTDTVPPAEPLPAI